MRVCIATSALTFVPGNYDDFVLPLLESPHVAGLLVDDNRENQFVAKAAALMLTGAAPRFGLTLLKNRFGDSLARREEACRRHGKLFRLVEDLNADETAAWLSAGQFDLIFDARTRTFFRKRLLAIPRLGCVNIHHGLLPEQRGLMCDFWSHLDGGPAGFSLHVMTPKLDDGRILKRVAHPADKQDYLEFIHKGARLEAGTSLELLNEIARLGGLPAGEPNHAEHAVYRRNPGLKDFIRLRTKGVRL